MTTDSATLAFPKSPIRDPLGAFDDDEPMLKKLDDPDGSAAKPTPGCQERKGMDGKRKRTDTLAPRQRRRPRGPSRSRDHRGPRGSPRTARTDENREATEDRGDRRERRESPRTAEDHESQAAKPTPHLQRPQPASRGTSNQPALLIQQADKPELNTQPEALAQATEPPPADQPEAGARGGPDKAAAASPVKVAAEALEEAEPDWTAEDHEPQAAELGEATPTPDWTAEDDVNAQWVLANSPMNRVGVFPDSEDHSPTTPVNDDSMDPVVPSPPAPRPGPAHASADTSATQGECPQHPQGGLALHRQARYCAHGDSESDIM